MFIQPKFGGSVRFGNLSMLRQRKEYNDIDKVIEDNKSLMNKIVLEEKGNGSAPRMTNLDLLAAIEDYANEINEDPYDKVGILKLLEKGVAPDDAEKIQDALRTLIGSNILKISSQECSWFDVTFLQKAKTLLENRDKLIPKKS